MHSPAAAVPAPDQQIQVHAEWLLRSAWFAVAHFVFFIPSLSCFPLFSTSFF
jgi:hypothetical protein